MQYTLVIIDDASLVHLERYPDKTSRKDAAVGILYGNYSELDPLEEITDPGAEDPDDIIRDIEQELQSTASVDVHLTEEPDPEPVLDQTIHTIVIGERIEHYLDRDQAVTRNLALFAEHGTAPTLYTSDPQPDGSHTNQR